jgi:hypothetical protein
MKEGTMFEQMVVVHAEERYRDMLREAEKERLVRGLRPARGLARLLVALGLC